MNVQRVVGPRGWGAGRVVGVTLLVILVGILLWLLYWLVGLILVVFAAGIIAAALHPAVKWLERKGLPPWVSMIGTYILLLAIAIGILIWIVPLLSGQTIQFGGAVPNFYQQFRNVLLHSSNLVVQRLGMELPTQFQLGSLLTSTASSASASGTAGRFARMALLLARAGLIVLLVLLFAYYWTVEADWMKEGLARLVDEARREYYFSFLEEVIRRLGHYVRAQLVLMITVGIFAFIAYFIIGLPYAPVLALIAGLLEAVPVIGAILGVVPASLVAVATGNAFDVVWIIVATIFIHAMEAYILVPNIMHESVGVDQIATLIALAIFGELLGLPGALLAVPMTVVILLLIRYYTVEGRTVDEESLVGHDRINLLRYRTQQLTGDLHEALTEKKTPPTNGADEMEDNLERVIEELEEILTEAARRPAQ